MNPKLIQLLLGVINAAGTIGGSLLGSGNIPKETPNQAIQRNTIDDVMSSIKGDGPFSHLFNADEDAFQRSVVDPSLNRFNNQIAPAIQQRFLAQDDGTGSGLTNALTQAGVDLNSNIDNLFLPFQQQAQNRSLQGLNSILGAGAGAGVQPTGSERFGDAAGGFFAGDGFSNILRAFQPDQFGNSQSNQQGVDTGLKESTERSGFTSDSDSSIGGLVGNLIREASGRGSGQGQNSGTPFAQSFEPFNTGFGEQQPQTGSGQSSFMQAFQEFLNKSGIAL